LDPGPGKPSLNSTILDMMGSDKNSYNSPREFAAGRARALQLLFKREKDEQKKWDQKNGKHDYNRPEFHKKP